MSPLRSIRISWWIQRYSWCSFSMDLFSSLNKKDWRVINLGFTCGQVDSCWRGQNHSLRSFPDGSQRREKRYLATVLVDFLPLWHNTMIKTKLEKDLYDSWEIRVHYGRDPSSELQPWWSQKEKGSTYFQEGYGNREKGWWSYLNSKPILNDMWSYLLSINKHHKPL